MNILFCAAYISFNLDNHKNKIEYPDNFEYIQNYYNSIIKHNASAVILVNNASDIFINKHTNEYVKIHLFDIKSISVSPDYYFPKKNNLFNIQPHDLRFYKFYDYIKKRSDIKYFVLSDISDVTILQPPDEKFINDDNILYFCRENEIIKDNLWFKAYTKHIKNKYNVFFSELNNIQNETVLNCGIICGERSLLLSFLLQIVNMMSIMYSVGKKNIKTYPLDMFVVNYIAYTKFYKYLDITNNIPPFHTKFGHYKHDPIKYMMHK